MFDVGLKALILWTVVGLAAGGGIYGSYVKLFGQAAKSQVNGYSLVNDCSFLLTSYNTLEIESFLNKISDEGEGLRKSDGVMVAIATGAGERRPQEAAIGTSLNICVDNLKKHLSTIKS